MKRCYKLDKSRINHEVENKELICIINQNGFELNWQQSTEELDKKQIKAQKILLEKYPKNNDELLFYLAFSRPLTSLSASLLFLSKTAQSFVNKLAKLQTLSY